MIGRRSLLAMLSALLVLVASLEGPHVAAAPRPAARSTSPAAASTTYRVKAGDTLFAIASRHRVTVASLVTANRLAGPGVRLLVGQALVIPSGTPTVARARRPVSPALASAPVATRAPVALRAPAVVRTPLVPPRTLVLALPDFAELVPLFAWPVDGLVSSTFGRRRMGWHRGIDIKAEFGAPVAASAAGTVVTSAYETRYGRVVKIEHLNGFMTVYAHNDENLVEAGARVMPGQVIAAVGRTGRATAPHVHFEIRQAGFAYNPLYMLPLPPRVTLIEETSEEDHEDVDE